MVCVDLTVVFGLGGLGVAAGFLLSLSSVSVGVSFSDVTVPRRLLSRSIGVPVVVSGSVFLSATATISLGSISISVSNIEFLDVSVLVAVATEQRTSLPSLVAAASVPALHMPGPLPESSSLFPPKVSSSSSEVSESSSLLSMGWPANIPVNYSGLW